MSHGLPVDEAWLPVALPLIAAVAAGLAVRALLPRLLVAGRRGPTVASSIGLAAFGFVAGFDALGPDLAGGNARWAGWVFGVALAAIAAGLPWLRRKDDDEDEAPARGSASLVLGLALGLLPLGLWVGAESALAFDEVEGVGESRARWRRRMAPRDPAAWLALARVERDRERLEVALALADVATSLDDGSREAELLELRSDIHAARGECDEARALFDQALEARARAALETFDLDLSRSYRLPRALAAECGWGPAGSDSDSE